jgi:DNA-binding LytR/AlgR family response regulator
VLRLRTLVADDEPLAQRRLQLLLSSMDGVELIGTASGRMEARKLIERHKPDLVLLDIRMRDGTGFDLLDELDDEDVPAVVFVTAFDSYATRAFDAAAVDYVLKPIEEARLQKALDRARDQLANREGAARMAEMRAVLDALRSEDGKRTNGYETEFWVRRNASGLVRVPVDGIDHITAEVDYVRLHLKGHSYLAKETLANLQTRLDPKQFIRVHRSSIVRLAAVKEIKRVGVGAVEVHMLNGARLRVGRAFNRALRDALRVN